MPDWLTGLLDKNPITILLGLLNDIRWPLGTLFAIVAGIAYRAGILKRCSQRDLESWCSLLGHTDEAKQQEAQEKLIACSAKTVSPLADTLHRTDSDKQREKIVTVLCEIGAPALRSLMLSRREEITEGLIDKALGQELPKIVDKQQRDFEYATAWKRFWNRRTRSPRQEIVDHLIALLDDPDAIVQEGAAIAIGQYPLPEVVQQLGRRLYPTETKNAQVRRAIADSLGQLGQADAIPFLRIGLKDTNGDVRIAACRALSGLGQDEAILDLEDILLPFEEPEVRIEAARALALIGGTKAQAILERALQPENIPDDDTRRELRTELGSQLVAMQRGLYQKQ